ncbi:ABC transporter permease [Janibacter anophelis]|uniref:ABC transporter permease n=1 Tax=Janibacter anophelis TaxID=319054 RepID=UPI003F7D67A6
MSLHAAGVGTSLRVQWRTGWKAALAWVLGLFTLVLTTTSSITSLYDTPAKLRTYAESIATPALRMLNGDVAGVDTLGGVLVNELGFVVAFAVPLCAIAMTVRGTRREEEAGRLELLLASRMGRQAPLVAAVVLALASLAALGALTTLAFLAASADATGSVIYGATVMALGAVFVGVTAVLAQAFGHQRSVWGAALGTVVVSYLVRGIGAVDGTWVVWLSPHGWYDEAAPFGEPRVTPFVLAAVVTAGLIALALSLSAGRDVGGSLIAARTGPRRASAGLLTPLGLALREHLTVTLGWAVITGVLMGTYGSLTQTVIDAFAGNPDLEVFLGGGEAGIIEPMVAMFVLLLSMLVAGYVLQSLGSLRKEELSGRLELQLSEARSRTTWLAPHLLVIAAGTLVLAAVGALALAISTASALDDSSWIGTILAAGAAHLPVALLFAGASLALFGWVPRAQVAVWGIFAATAVIGYMGPGLDLPQWLVEWAPFGLVGNVPAEDVDATGSLVAAGGGLALAALGVLGFARRDVPHR